MALFLETPLIGQDNVLVGPAAISEAGSQNIGFLSDPEMLDPCIKANLGLVITSENLAMHLEAAGVPTVIHRNPKFAFCKVVYHLMRIDPTPSIHPTAIIDESAKVDESATVGPYCIIGEGVELSCRCVLEDHVTLYKGVRVGEGTIIRSGAKIGYEPFSFGRDTDGRSYSYPSSGAVQIGAFVDIYHNVSIARGAAGDTILEDWVRVGNCAHLGNTVHVGLGTIVCAHTDISARVKIGANAWIAPSAAIRQNLKVGNGAMVGMGAVVINDVEAYSTVVGVPARAQATA